MNLRLRLKVLNLNFIFEFIFILIISNSYDLDCALPPLVHYVNSNYAGEDLLLQLSQRSNFKAMLGIFANFYRCDR